MRVQDAGFRVQGAGCRVLGAGCRVQGAGCRVQGAGCRVQGADHARLEAAVGGEALALPVLFAQRLIERDSSLLTNYWFKSTLSSR